MIKHVYKCDACSKQVHEQEESAGLGLGGHSLPVGWTRVSVTHASKRPEATSFGEEPTNILGILAKQYQRHLGEMPMVQTADCDLCDECGPKLANFFHSIGSPLRVREGLGIAPLGGE